MEKPQWIPIIGIFGVVLACLGIYSSGQSLVFSRLIEFQKIMDANIQEVFDKLEIEKDSKDVKTMPSREFFEIKSKMYNVPVWFYKWSIIFGVIGFPVYGFYLFASLWLYLTKRKSVTLFYFTVGLVITFSLLKTVVAMFNETFFGFTILAGSLFMLVVNVVLLIVFALSNKQFFVISEV